ncbi:hypothetical protein VNN41_06575 [Lactococcus garvieae]|uniref:hypothetical protein n=1 Tax=Lactococcus garvieae TaxID=1363 RepID=UPI00324D4D23
MKKVFQTIKSENLKSIEFDNENTIPFSSNIFKINGIEISEYGGGIMDIVIELPANSAPKVTIIGHKEKMDHGLILELGLEDDSWKKVDK